MKKNFVFMSLQLIVYLMSLIYVTEMNAQFPTTIILNANDPSIIESPLTIEGRSYTITVSGTYSMWPTNDSWGVDAAYLYNVPQEEIDALRWPPQNFLNYKIYELPYWVGTDKEIPPVNIPGINYKIVSRNHIGFRYNGNWLPNSGYNPNTHTYQVKVMGNGEPIKFQILDSSFSVSEMRVMPKYDDNSGSLKVVIEEEPVLNICNTELICEAGEIVGIKLSAALFEYINEFTGQPVNLLREIGPEQMGIAIDGNFICPDSINCDTRVEGGVAWCLVFDRSGSMNDMFGNTTKMEALRSSANKFLSHFGKDDEGMLITFNSLVTENVPWTKDVSKLQNVINGLMPGGRTAYFDAALTGVKKTFPHNNPNKAIILLSDGEDNESIATETKLIREAQEKNIRIFTIGVNIFAETQASMKRIAVKTGGKYYTANDPEAMNAVFEAIERDVAESECCDIYFSIPEKVLQKDKPYKTKISIMTFDHNGQIIVKEIEITITDSCDTEVSFIDENYDQIQTGKIKVAPNPSKSVSTISFTTNYPGDAQIKVFSMLGREIYSQNLGYIAKGSYEHKIDIEPLPQGAYIVQISVSGMYLTQKFIVVH
jgi:hypothetical protein